MPPHYIFTITQLNQNGAGSQLIDKRLNMGGFVRCKHNQTDGCLGRKYLIICTTSIFCMVVRGVFEWRPKDKGPLWARGGTTFWPFFFGLYSKTPRTTIQKIDIAYIIRCECSQMLRSAHMNQTEITLRCNLQSCLYTTCTLQTLQSELILVIIIEQRKKKKKNMNIIDQMHNDK